MNMQALDTRLFFAINQGTENRFFDILMPALTERGYFLFLPYIVYLLYKGSSVKNSGDRSYLIPALWTLFIAACAFPLADWIGNMIKHGVARIRPCHVLEGIRLLVGCTKSYSMPSNHAVTSFAFATPLFYLAREYVPFVWRLYPLIIASAVSFSRVYVGVHYPSDVIAGALLGATVAILLIILYKRIMVRTSSG
jgi:undecaprenyl-diphosphatase